jgi:hypothetical protein
MLTSLNTGDWRALVYRELQADNWYAQPTIVETPEMHGMEVVQTKQHPLALNVTGNGAQPQRVSE